MASSDSCAATGSDPVKAVADSSAAAPAAAAAGSANGGRAVFPTLFVTHGGGPSYFMDIPEGHRFYAISARSINAQWLRDFRTLYNLEGASAPKALVVVSAHWETSGHKVRVTSKQQHTKLNYDYGGFPPHTYKLEYSPKGDPALSARIVSLLKAGGVDAEVDPSWEFDHGVFVPLKMMWPEASVPVVEISIDHSWDPAWHLRVGRALAPLKREGVFLIGSGSSTHNFNPHGPSNAAFMRALTAVIEAPVAGDPAKQAELERRVVLEWTKLPHARDAHPAEDHLVPLFVVVGAAGAEQQGRLVGKVEPAGDWHTASFLFE